MSDTAPQLLWYRSLKFYGILLPALMVVGILFGNAWIIQTKGRQLILENSNKFIEQIGNNMVSDLTARTREMTALTQSIAILAQNLPKTVESFQSIVPPVIDYYGNSDIAGGGVWPEANAFDPEQERRSFFWGREQDGSLKYYDDYNQPGPGYHHEEWYVVVPYLEKGRASWSRSYLDPYSLQPMVTCTVATRDGSGKFTGTVTVDLRLEGLQAFADYWQKKTGGYLFITDQFNTFITFPKPDLVRLNEVDSQGRRGQRIISARELAARQPAFTPLAAMLAAMNQSILDAAAQMPGYDDSVAAKLDTASYQINAEDAKLLSAITSDPLVRQTFYKAFEVPVDFINEAPSTAYSFFVPGSYWKVVIVKPTEEIGATARNIVKLNLHYSLLVAIPLLALIYFLFDWLLFQRLRQLLRHSSEIHDLTARRQFFALQDISMAGTARDEVGIIGSTVDMLRRQVLQLHHDAVELQETLRHEHTAAQERENELHRQNLQLEQNPQADPQASAAPAMPAPAPAEVNQLKAKLAREYAYLQKLRLPGVEILDGVILVPKLNNFDAAGMEMLLKVIGEFGREREMRFVLLDFSAFVGNAPQAAAALRQFVATLKLMGLTPVVSGLPPALAKALQDSGAGIDGVPGFNRLPRALEYIQACLRDPHA